MYYAATKCTETDQDDNEGTDNTVNMGVSNDTNASYGTKNLDRKTSKLQENKVHAEPTVPSSVEILE